MDKSKKETKRERAEREARELLENANMEKFDRMMRSLVSDSPKKTESKTPKA
jgi:hypothetical protein